MYKTSKCFNCLILTLILAISALAQVSTETVPTRDYLFQTIPGKLYAVTVTTDDQSDIVFGISEVDGRPAYVVNSKPAGYSESFAVNAATDRMRVSVYPASAKHHVVVMDKEQRYPFLMRTWEGDLKIETPAGSGKDRRFNFEWSEPPGLNPYTSVKTRDFQTITPYSGAIYKYNVTPGVPLDVLVVPETNHFDVTLNIDNGGILETDDNNRDPSDLRITGKGQNEWTQITPSSNTIKLIVTDKSGFGGNFRLALRPVVDSTLVLTPTEARSLNPVELRGMIDEYALIYPLISDRYATTFVISKERLVEFYGFVAESVGAGPKFAIEVRADSSSPPLYIFSGGNQRQTANFAWKYRDGRIVFDGGNLTSYAGYPQRGQVQITIFNVEGSGRIRPLLRDAGTLRALDLPEPKMVDREDFSWKNDSPFEGYLGTNDNMVFFRYAAKEGEKYKIKAMPSPYLDISILDPSKRSEDNPVALELIDKAGTGRFEEAEVVANGDTIEFGIAGMRYSGGVVKPENRRFGGRGYFELEVTNESGSDAERLGTAYYPFPNFVVSKAVGVPFDLGDDIVLVFDSPLQPFPAEWDRRVIEAFGK